MFPPDIINDKQKEMYQYKKENQLCLNFGFCGEYVYYKTGFIFDAYR